MWVTQLQQWHLDVFGCCSGWLCDLDLRFISTGYGMLGAEWHCEVQQQQEGVVQALRMPFVDIAVAILHQQECAAHCTTVCCARHHTT